MPGSDSSGRRLTFWQIIYNISPTLLPQELLSPFFAYGVGFPVWYVIFLMSISSYLRNSRNPGICKFSLPFLGCVSKHSHSSQAVRTILFNTASHLGRNAGVMLGWVVLSCGTTVLFTWWMHRRELAALLADQTTSLDRQEVRSREHIAHGVEEKQ